MLRGSLDNIRVADFSQIGAGPTCSMFLGDLGADVVKVEPVSGDIGRALGPPWTSVDQSAVFTAFNRNKRSIALDLKSVVGKDVALRLIATADVVIESFRPGVMDRLGLGYEACRALRSDIIYCSVSAYGSTGPGAALGGVDGIVQANSGLMGLVGEEGQAPGKVQAPIVDVATGHLATVAVLAQLFQRERTGIGGFLDVSMLAAAISLQQSSLTAYLGEHTLPQRIGSAAPYAAPNEAFPAADGWIMLAAYQNGRWERLCDLLDRPDLKNDPLLSSSSLRVANRKLMFDAVADEFGKHDCAYWLKTLEEADILCAKVCNYDDLMQSELLAELKLIVTQNDSRGREFSFPGFPVNPQENQLIPHRLPPECGEHGRQILAELGYIPSEIQTILSQ
jgi:crotonobetainyl-CoA:carnitine CoA-transferase CaiB-like acyl-CoA transferase